MLPELASSSSSIQLLKADSSPSAVLVFPLEVMTFICRPVLTVLPQLYYFITGGRCKGLVVVADFEFGEPGAGELVGQLGMRTPDVGVEFLPAYVAESIPL